MKRASLTPAMQSAFARDSFTMIRSPEEMDLSDLDRRWLDRATGRVLPIPAAEVRAQCPRRVRLWMHHKALYVFPTRELCHWLWAEIGQRPAIEVGAGNASLYFWLRIPGTDSFIQQTPEMAEYYAALGNQPRTNPPADVLPMSANEAVTHFRPAVVVACYLTRRFLPGFDKEGEAQASTHGADEQAIIRGCRTYIHIGNRATHGTKTALKLPHRELSFPWLVTRGAPENDVIYQWGA